MDNIDGLLLTVSDEGIDSRSRCQNIFSLQHGLVLLLIARDCFEPYLAGPILDWLELEWPAILIPDGEPQRAIEWEEIRSDFWPAYNRVADYKGEYTRLTPGKDWWRWSYLYYEEADNTLSARIDRAIQRLRPGNWSDEVLAGVVERLSE